MADTSEALKVRFLEAAKSLLDGEPIKMAKGIDDSQLGAVYSLGYSYYQTGRYDEALKLFKFLVLMDHLSQKYWLALGSAHQMLKNYDDAIKSFAQAALLDLNNPKPMYYAALCHLAKNDKVSAASAVRAIEMFCTKVEAKNAPFMEKAKALRAMLGDEPFAELKRLDEQSAGEKDA